MPEKKSRELTTPPESPNSAIFCSQAESLRLHVILHEWQDFYSPFFFNIHRSGVFTVLAWLVPHETAAVSAQVLFAPYVLSHFMQSHICKVYVCLAVTYHLHFWQNGQDLWHATVVTQGWNRYRNKSQHRKLTLEKKILPPLHLWPFNHESSTLTSELSLPHLKFISRLILFRRLFSQTWVDHSCENRLCAQLSVYGVRWFIEFLFCNTVCTVWGAGYPILSLWTEPICPVLHFEKGKEKSHNLCWQSVGVGRIQCMQWYEYCNSYLKEKNLQQG